MSLLFTEFYLHITLTIISENLILIIWNHVYVISELMFPYTMKLRLKKVPMSYNKRKEVLISITLQEIKKSLRVFFFFYNQILSSVSKWYCFNSKKTIYYFIFCVIFILDYWVMGWMKVSRKCIINQKKYV